MKIYDCFSYWDEDLLLELRLNILNEYVDYFVIIEGNKTWQNNFKELQFDIEKFEKFKNKIIYIPVVDMPDGDNPYLRENFQRNCISRGLEDAKDDDLITKSLFHHLSESCEYLPDQTNMLETWINTNKYDWIKKKQSK